MRHFMQFNRPGRRQSNRLEEQPKAGKLPMNRRPLIELLEARQLLSVPAMPSNASVVMLSPILAQVTWSDNSSDELGFKVYRATDQDGSATTYDPGAFAQVGTTTIANATAADDPIAAGNAIYYYYVTSSNASGDSTASNVAAVTTLPVASVTETWTGNNSDPWPGSTNVPPTWGNSLAASFTKTIQGYTGRLTGAQGTAIVYNTAASYQDSVQVISLQAATSNGPQLGMFARAADTNGDGKYDSGYAFETSYVDNITSPSYGAQTLSIYKYTDGSAVRLGGTVSIPQQSIVVAPYWYNLKLIVSTSDTTTTITGEIWKSSSDESTGWSITRTDSTPIPTSGYGGIWLTSNSTGRYVYADNYSEVSAANMPTVPAAPTAPAATATGPTTVNLTWTDNASSENGYKIERSLNGSTWTQIGTTAANTQAFTDTTAPSSFTSSYRVRAHNLGGNSNYTSPIVTATTTADTIAPVAAAVSRRRRPWPMSPRRSARASRMSPPATAISPQQSTSSTPLAPPARARPSQVSSVPLRCRSAARWTPGFSRA